MKWGGRSMAPQPGLVPELIDSGPAALPALPDEVMRPLVREIVAAIVKELRAEDAAAESAAPESTTPHASAGGRR